MSSSANEDVDVLKGPSELIGGSELDGVSVAVKVDRDQLYEDDAIPVLASDLGREVAAELEAIERGEEQAEFITDGGVAEDLSTSTSRSWPNVERTLTFAFVLAFLTHGPLDVLLTTAAFHLEANSLVTDLGVIPWVGVKVGTLAVATFAWYDAPKFNPRPYIVEAVLLLGFISGYGGAFVLLNVVTLAEVVG